MVIATGIQMEFRCGEEGGSQSYAMLLQFCFRQVERQEWIQ